MSQLSPHPAYLLIEDLLDSIGQKWRSTQILRGFLLFSAFAFLSTFAAATTAHFTAQGFLTTAITILWIAWLIASFAWWILRPLFLRPQNLKVARLVETRIPGLHNGLTNSLLLARADDLQQSPFLSEIFDEILATTRAQPLDSAVKISDLRPLLLRLAAILLPLLLSLVFPSIRGSLQQGWRQMFNPTTFIPKVGKVRILEISPKQITLVAGQPLDISALAEDPDNRLPNAQLIFEKDQHPKSQLPPTLTPDNQLKYSYHLDHIDEPTRFRLEVGGTQSEWCDVTVVKQVKLQQLILNISPPTYTGKPNQNVLLKPDDIAKTPISVLEGSRVEIAIVSDVPVKSALLQLNQDSPSPMSIAQQGQRFSASAIIMQPTDLSALLTENGQVIARLPDPPLRINCTKDAVPAIEMKWPTQDTTVPPNLELKISALIKDDLGLASARILISTSADLPLGVIHEQRFGDGTTSAELLHTLTIPAQFRVHGQSIRVQIEATDNRNLASLLNSGPGSPTSTNQTGPQTTPSPIYEIKFRDPQEIAKQQKEDLDKLRAALLEMIKKQKDLHTLAVAWRTGSPTMVAINRGQADLRQQMHLVAENIHFAPEDRIVQKTLLVLVQNPAREAIEISTAIQTEPLPAEQLKLNRALQSQQRRIIDTLESLLSRTSARAIAATQPTRPGGDLENEREKLKELDEALKKFIAEEKRILDATATLAKKPVDNYDDNDKKLLEELKLSQDKLDAFMQEKISDFSKLAEQDMANASLLKEMMEVYSEVTMAKNALKNKAAEIAVPLEEMGLELAKELSSNIEKWLSDKPDREKWNQEDPLGKQDIPMAELPRELEDMVGELMEEQEDLFEEMEDTAANFADSIDKGAGWDAADGPIANMSAKGVTGNQNPNNNEMNGRSGEGRSGKSQGEMVEETATGKGGRMTPTRLDPTPFQQGQVRDTSKDPVGGATGGGKMSGQGGQGLEGPVPPKDLQDKMQRLAGKQAELRNKAERLNLDKKAARYDGFKLLEAVALMRRVESDIASNRYNNALRRRDIMLDRMDESHLLLSGQLHVQKDTSPTASDRMEDQINDVVNGNLPAAWSESLKEFYKKLAQQ
jgi:hypothetical protein